MIEKAYKKALETIDLCSQKQGLYASGGKKGYRGVWARDSIISLIGAITEDKKDYKEIFKRSLLTLGEKQSKRGQIPNAVHGFEDKKLKVDYISIDSSLWFIIGHYIYKEKYGNSLFKKENKKIKKALTWIEYRDFGEEGLPDQLPTTDWQDAFPHKYGEVINTQALYYKILKLMKNKKANKIRKIVNQDKEHGLWNGNYYWAYRWKNHNKYKEIGEWFDSLGNLLAIIFDLADKKQSEKIITYIKKNKINKPFPVKAIWPPIKKGSKYWEDYFLDCDAGKPFHYLNGGIWPFIGGFYVLALIKMKKFKEAKKELQLLAESNTKNNPFPEWINPLDKKTHGVYQAWSAGLYILAYNSLKKKKVLI
ncbi:MAG: glycoside hydrolase 100 family protein [Candidatus Pacearchaeota archaeon]